MRGGAPLKSIVEDECPVEMRDHIFTSATREVITLSPFLALSLILILALAQPLR